MNIYPLSESPHRRRTHNEHPSQGLPSRPAERSPLFAVSEGVANPPWGICPPGPRPTSSPAIAENSFKRQSSGS